MVISRSLMEPCQLGCDPFVYQAFQSSGPTPLPLSLLGGPIARAFLDTSCEKTAVSYSLGVLCRMSWPQACKAYHFLRLHSLGIDHWENTLRKPCCAWAVGHMRAEPPCATGMCHPPWCFAPFP